MSSSTEEGLSWAGDHDPSLIASESPDESTVQQQPVQEQSAPAQQNTLWPSLFGIFIGVMVLYLVGWAIFIFSNPVLHLVPGTPTAAVFIAASMYEFGEALTIALPLLWLAAVFMTIPPEKKLKRLVWLLVGAVLLIPWPFVLGGLVQL